MADSPPAQQQQGQASNQGQQQQQAKNPLNNLIRPEQIARVPGLSDEMRKRYMDGATSFWHLVQNKPPSDPAYQEAVTKLTQLTNAVQNLMKKAREQQQQKASQAQAPTSQAPQSQPMQRPPSQSQQVQANGQNVNNAQQATDAPAQSRSMGPQPPPFEQIPENIRKIAESYNFLPPPQHPNPQSYKQEAKARFAQQLYLQQTAKQQIQVIQQRESQARANGQPIPEQLIQSRRSAESQFTQSTTFINQLKTQQDTLRASQANMQQSTSQQQAMNAKGPQLNNNSSNQNAAQQQGTAGPNAQQRPPPQNTSAQQQQQVNRQGLASSPTTVQAPTPTALSQQAQQQNQQQNQQVPRPQQPNQITNGPFAQGSPQTSIPTNAQAPNPYNHQGAAMESQRSYSSGGTTTTQQSVAPQMTNPNFTTPSTDKSTKWPINKDFTPARPTPVSMGPMRPTMSNPGSGPGGPMGQPAIQQAPSYNLHGPGDHVLNKKKLDELVRQVCGAGDGVAPQGLHPEVEESVLELADEFFDNVVMSACRLAKLRGSQTLEIRDIQLVLQRQYNIRIPGYSTDEVRTVRKVQPTASYLQKMNAVQAAKVMGGKGD